MQVKKLGSAIEALPPTSHHMPARHPRVNASPHHSSALNIASHLQQPNTLSIYSAPTMAQPTPQTWTLRLKSHRTTVLLHIDPLHTFPAIKSTLYTALQETGLRASSTGPEIPLPPSPSHIQFGRPVDPLDPSQGFTLGEWETPAVDEEVDIDEGKGKGKAAKGGKKTADARDCPKGAGLKDGSVLAFRWEGDGGGEEAGWGVKIASFEDAYGVLNEGDVGGRGEFDG